MFQIRKIATFITVTYNAFAFQIWTLVYIKHCQFPLANLPNLVAYQKVLDNQGFNFDLMPGLLGFNPGWKIRDPGW